MRSLQSADQRWCVDKNEEVAIGFLARLRQGCRAASSASSFYGVAWIEGVIDFGSGGMASGLSSLATTSLRPVAGVRRMPGSRSPRRARQLSETLALRTCLGERQPTLAQDQVQIVVQERVISSLQLDHAQEILDFLTARQVGASLYEWMSGPARADLPPSSSSKRPRSRQARPSCSWRSRQQAKAGGVHPGADYSHAAGDGRTGEQRRLDAPRSPRPHKLDTGYSGDSRTELRTNTRSDTGRAQVAVDQDDLARPNSNHDRTSSSLPARPA